MLQAIISDPADEELHLLYIDLATGITTSHDIPDRIEDAEHVPQPIDTRAALPASERADEPLPEKLT